MKRKAHTEKNCAKKQKKSCVICYEDTEENECRRCKINICNDCFVKHMIMSVEKSITYEKPPELECPHCRLQPWFKPDFVVHAKGKPFTTDKCLQVYAGGRRPFYMHALHDEENIVGYAILNSKEADTNIKDVEKLEPVAMDFKHLIPGLVESPGCICQLEKGDDTDWEYLKQQLRKAEVGYKEFIVEGHTEKYLAIECIEDFIVPGILGKGLNIF